MTQTILSLLLAGMEIFSDERKRNLAERLIALQKNLESEKAKRFPSYNSDREALAQKELDIFIVAYQKEFTETLAGVLGKKASEVFGADNS